ncbi:uncharacterized protein PAC_04543 [Phialocephala subalpina]|uniref:Uncharacterized protein n=1 Tax=Phialocephala subalpina TaxID=576137 RepID=A0A1L7WPG1_9HELO|nr:uncharacterized protein PAC_04543 [Phialocephala subalpina]
MGQVPSSSKRLSLRQFPPEVRRLIFEHTIKWHGRPIPLLATLRSDRQLYHEALEVLNRICVFTMTDDHLDNFGPGWLRMSDFAMGITQRLNISLWLSAQTSIIKFSICIPKAIEEEVRALPRIWSGNTYPLDAVDELVRVLTFGLGVQGLYEAKVEGGRESTTWSWKAKVGGQRLEWEQPGTLAER